MSSRYKHGSTREGVQQLLAELRDAESPLKSRNLLLYVHFKKWFILIDSSIDPPRSVSVRSCNEFTFLYTTRTSDTDPQLITPVGISFRLHGSTNHLAEIPLRAGGKMDTDVGKTD